jgi:hypothetical protein
MLNILVVTNNDHTLCSSRRITYHVTICQHHGDGQQSFLSSRLHLLLRWMRIWKHCVWLCYHPWLFVLPTLTLPSPGCSITWLRCHEDESRQGWNLPGGMFVYGFGAHRTGKDLCLCEATLLLLLVSMKQLHWVDVRISFLSYSCVFSVGSCPFSDDYLPRAVCGICYLQCYPKVGCCLPPPECAALERLTDKPITAEPISAQPVSVEMVMRRDCEYRHEWGFRFLSFLNQPLFICSGRGTFKEPYLYYPSSYSTMILRSFASKTPYSTLSNTCNGPAIFYIYLQQNNIDLPSIRSNIHPLTPFQTATGVFCLLISPAWIILLFVEQGFEMTRIHGE